MGACGSSLTEEQQRAKQRTRQLEKKMKRREKAEENIHKLLLLGAGESGKSTMFKQMVKLYGEGFSTSDREDMKKVIYSNVLISIKQLLEKTEEEKFTPLATAEAKASKQFFDEEVVNTDVEYGDPIDEKIGAHIATIWADSGFQATYAERAQYQLKLNDSLDYYMSRLDALKAANYVPSDDDILRTRAKTTGIIEKRFEIQGTKLSMFDVGGQRNERKKWIHCFTEVKALLFVAAISEYDQKLIEDPDMNRIYESLNLFQQLVNSQWFDMTSTILFLNKMDLFKKKIPRVPITVAFPDFPGDNPNDEEEAAQHITDHYEDRVANIDERPFFVHTTCATDSKIMKNVFDAVKETVLLGAIQEADMV